MQIFAHRAVQCAVCVLANNILTFWPLTLRLPHTSCISDIYHLKKHHTSHSLIKTPHAHFNSSDLTIERRVLTSQGVDANTTFGLQRLTRFSRRQHKVLLKAVSGGLTSCARPRWTIVSTHVSHTWATTNVWGPKNPICLQTWTLWIDDDDLWKWWRYHILVNLIICVKWKRFSAF